MPFFPLPLAVHISDGLLAPPWLLGGFLVAGLFAFWGAWRTREEEIPRIALLTAAFFVASSIHVSIPSGSIHLLLSGLVGVVLGRRAALAIPIGLAMQAFLLNHGGATAIGVNSCVQVVPALTAWQMFARLRRLPFDQRPGFRAGLVGVSVLIWVPSLIFSIILLIGSWSGDSNLDTGRAGAIALHPLGLAVAAGLAVLGVWTERRMDNAPEFPLGLLIGEFAVLLAVALKCAVLIAGGEQDLGRWALVETITHLPIAVIEGIILGFTVGFLARVKPELLAPSIVPPNEGQRTKDKGRRNAVRWAGFPVFLFVILGPSSFVFAHRLNVEAAIQPFGAVQVETWFETGDSPKAAKVQVFTFDGRLLTEGHCDERGCFVFAYAGTEPLRVVVNAGAGHRAEAAVSSEMLAKHAICLAAACLAPPPLLLAGPLLVRLKVSDLSAPSPLVERNTGAPIGRLAVGVGALLAVATVVLMRQRWSRTRTAPSGR